MFVQEVAVGHAGEIIAHGTLESLAGEAADCAAPQEGGIADVEIEDIAQHAAGAAIHDGDAGIVVEIRVEELAELAIRGAELRAVADERAALAADVGGALHAAGCDGLGAVGDDVLDLAVDNAPDDVAVEFRAGETGEIVTDFLVAVTPDIEVIELARFDEAGIEAVVKVVGVVGDFVGQIGDLGLEGGLVNGWRGGCGGFGFGPGSRQGRRGAGRACGGPRALRRRD